MLPSQSELNTLLDYDPLTGMLVWKFRPNGPKTWNTRYAGKEAFTAINKYGYKVGAIHDTVYLASRIIWKMVHGVDPIQVDHEDGDTLNNRLKNLRNVTQAQNQQNTKLRSNNTSGVTGVCWDKSKQRWLVSIGVSGKSKYVGRFKSFEEAVDARSQAEKDQNYHANHGKR